MFRIFQKILFVIYKNNLLHVVICLSDGIYNRNRNRNPTLNPNPNPNPNAKPNPNPNPNPNHIQPVTFHFREKK